MRHEAPESIAHFADSLAARHPIPNDYARTLHVCIATVYDTPGRQIQRVMPYDHQIAPTPIRAAKVTMPLAQAKHAIPLSS